MADTLEESLRSILDQIDERFEVLVVDDGSTDGSQEILKKLEEEYEELRWIEGENQNIGEARAQANREAKGNHILTQLDADDRYKSIISDFVNIYSKITEYKEREIYLRGRNINIAPKELLEKINYRSLERAEDKDLWSRMLDEEKLLPLKMGNVSKSIGYDYNKVQRLAVAYKTSREELRSGITLSSFIKWHLKNLNYVDDYFKVLISPIAFISAIKRGRFSQPEKFKQKGELSKQIEKESKTLNELEETYETGFHSFLSQQGKAIIYESD